MLEKCTLRRKLISFMLAAVMVVCMIPISAANAVMISIGSAELVVGETIELPVTVSSDVAIGSFDAQVVYDSSYLSLTKVKPRFKRYHNGR
ncbi:MAG: cohesin domain-containing protein [Christensenellales bacterium]